MRINKVRCKMTLFRDETRGKREDDTTWYDMTKTMTMTKALTMIIYNGIDNDNDMT